MFHLRKFPGTITTIVLIGVLLAACGSGSDDSISTTEGVDATTSAPIDAADDPAEDTDADHDEEADHDEDADHDAGFWFGEPATGVSADRVIEIEAQDDFTFTPPDLTVSVGETVTFRIHNVGNLPHDFTLGDAAMQDAHETEMMEGAMHAGDDPNALALEPGETGDMTFTFTEAGEIVFGCHVAGHYAAGMHGSLMIAA